MNVIREYDVHGNEIYYKNDDGYEGWYEYDSSGNLIRQTFTHGNGLPKVTYIKQHKTIAVWSKETYHG